MSKLFFYIAIGKLSIYFIQIFPATSLLFKIPRIGKYLEKGINCSLCLGTWVFAFFAYFFEINVTQEWFYVPILCEIITGAVISFIVWLASTGWKDEFGVFEVK
jgi:hypothetical protein